MDKFAGVGNEGRIKGSVVTGHILLRPFGSLLTYYFTISHYANTN